MIRAKRHGRRQFLGKLVAGASNAKWNEEPPKVEI
jgi:hypothetical protein